MGWHYRRNSENPFHSWWYNAAAVLQPVYMLFGFCLMLKRCEWTKSSARLTLAFVGWTAREKRWWWCAWLLAATAYAAVWGDLLSLGAGMVLFAHWPWDTDTPNQDPTS